MSFFSRSTKAVIIGGLFLIIPLLVLIILIKHALELLVPPVRKMVDYFNIHSIFGTATVTILAVLCIVLLCFLSGVLLRRGIINDWGEKMEEQLFFMFPSLQMLKYKMISDEDALSVTKKGWQSILLKEDEHYVIAFITNEDEKGFLSLYIPDAPKMDAGEIRLIKKIDCEFREISMKSAMQAISSFGKRGNLSAAVLESK